MPSVTLYPSSDVHIRANAAGANYNGSATMEIHTQYTSPSVGLLKFDVSGIPAGSTIDAAVLKLKRAGGNGSDAASKTYEAFKLNAAFVEATANWTNTSGIAKEATATASGAFVLAVGDIGSISGLQSDVQSWLDTPAGNHGWWVEEDTGNDGIWRSYHSGDATTEADRPTLEVTYTLAAGLLLNGPDSYTEGVADQAEGQSLNTVTTLRLQTDDEAFTVNQSMGTQTSATIDFTPNIGVTDATPGSPANGVPMEPTISATGITSYQAQQWVTDGSDVYDRNVTLNPAATHEVIQAMIAQANTTEGESIMTSSIIAVEDNMQFYVPKAANGMNITWAVDGTFTTDANQTETITVYALSPTTKQWSAHSLTIEADGVRSLASIVTIDEVELFVSPSLFPEEISAGSELDGTSSTDTTLGADSLVVRVVLDAFVSEDVNEFEPVDLSSLVIFDVVQTSLTSSIINIDLDRIRLRG